MSLIIDWDNYEVVESDDYLTWDLSDIIEEVRETMDLMVEDGKEIPAKLEDLLIELVEMEEVLTDED